MTDVQWTGTGGLSDTQSYSWIILNAIFERLSTTSFYRNFACRRISNALQIDPAIHIPFLGVFLGAETMSPDGDINAGDIRFTHAIPIGFQIVVMDNDPATMLSTLDRAAWFVLNQLLRDNTFTNRLKTTLPDNVTIEGVTNVRFQPDNWGITGLKNETPVGSRLFIMTFQLRTMWHPTDFPDLERITVTTAYPLEGTAEEQAQVQQVKVVYEFTAEGAVSPPLPPDT